MEPEFVGASLKDAPVLPNWADKRDLPTLTAAAERGEVEALVTLGWRYANGIAVNASPARAKTLLEKAVAQGSPRAMYLLARLRFDHPTGPGDAPAAVALLKQAAASGFIPSYTALIHLPYNTPGYDLSPDQVSDYINRAANGEVLDGMITLYFSNRIGNPPRIPKNPALADSWWKKIQASVQRPLMDVQTEDLTMMALALTSPDLPFISAERSPERILLLLRTAAAQGDTHAMTIMYQFYRDKSGAPMPFYTPLFPGVQPRPALEPPRARFAPAVTANEATTWLWTAAYCNNADAMYLAADLLFRDGLYDEASNWLRAAADRGHSDAKWRASTGLWRPLSP